MLHSSTDTITGREWMKQSTQLSWSSVSSLITVWYGLVLDCLWPPDLCHTCPFERLINTPRWVKGYISRTTYSEKEKEHNGILQNGGTNTKCYVQNNSANEWKPHTSYRIVLFPTLPSDLWCSALAFEMFWVTEAETLEANIQQWQSCELIHQWLSPPAHSSRLMATNPKAAAEHQLCQNCWRWKRWMFSFPVEIIVMNIFNFPQKILKIKTVDVWNIKLCNV